MTEDKLFIKESHKNKCPHCGITYSFENEDEVLCRNITLFYFRKNMTEMKAKCKYCKSIIIIKNN